MTGSWYGLNPEVASATLLKQVGTVGPEEIHIQLSHGRAGNQVAVKTDVPGVLIEVTKK